MTKYDFLKKLENELRSLPSNEIQDIIRDQNEYIVEAVNSGRSEAEVVSSLGDPAQLGRTLMAELKINAVNDMSASSSSKLNKKSLSGDFKKVFQASLALVALTPFNIIFVLGPFLGAIGCLVASWAVSAAIGVCGIVGFFWFFAKLIFVSAGIASHLSVFFFTVFIIGTGILSILFNYKLSEYFIKLAISYFRWNVNFVKGRA